MDTDESRQQVEAHVRRAYDIVRNVGIEEESLKLAAFAYALGQNGAGGLPDSVEPVVTSLHANKQPKADSGLPNSHEKIANALGVPITTIEVLYDIASDVLTLNLPTSALPRSSLAAMKEIAILLTIGRKYAGISASTTGTPFELIRTACDEQAKLDKKNFAMAMGSMRPLLTVVGKGTARELVAKKPADNLARDILLRYSQHIR
jgi:hypothetical protein